MTIDLRLLKIFVALAVAASALPCLAEPENEEAEGKAAAHVVLIIWDGMRPEFVTEEYAPTLWELARRGMTFRKHHSVYPTLTNVNATALATGVTPARSGLIGNYEFRPAIDPTEPTRTEKAETIEKGDKVSEGKYLRVPTVAELVQAHGGRTVVAGTKAAALLLGRNPGEDSEAVTLFEGETRPPGALSTLTEVLGPFPEKAIPNAAQEKWTSRALTEVLWKEEVPQFSVLWMSDPDRSEHEHGPGSRQALAAIKSADDNLALVLHALEEKGVLDATDILVASDHGFSTIERSVNLPNLLREAGFKLVEKRAVPLMRGEIRVVGNGGTALFYIGEKDEATTSRLVDWLQLTDFAGVIFSRAALEGTFPLADFHLDTPAAPDVVLAMRWNDGANKEGVHGMIAATATKEAAEGTHGTLSPFDVHNMLIAAGPHFRKSVSDMPSSNLDLAPTILRLLALEAPEPLDGRVLVEGFTGRQNAPKESVVRTREATRGTPKGLWRQYVRTSETAGSIYIDEGNGELQTE
ncbi:MAG: alkaline phosphatase family protein [Chthoniobacterales bacterium]